MIGIQFLYVLLAFFVFGLLVFIHELGHYLCARFCGVGIYEFAIGMGPKILGWQSKKTDIQYSLRLLPFGGHVSMVGEDEETDRTDAFDNCSIWRRMLIVVAGPVMNLLLGFLAMTLLVSTSGHLYGTRIIYPDSEQVQITDSEGLDNGDIILKVGAVRVFTRDELNYEVMRKGHEPLDITVLRDGKTVVIEDVTFRNFEEMGHVFGALDFYANEEPFTFGNVVKHTFFRSVSTVKRVVDSFVDLLNGRFGLDDMSGPVGITQSIGQSAAMGFSSFLYLFAFITINLGVFNLFPLPALDGGRLFFLLFEAIFRRKISKNVEGFIHLVGLVLLLGLLFVVTCKDILRLF